MKQDRDSLEVSYARTVLPLARKWRAAADRALAGNDMSAAVGWVLIQVGRLGDDVRQIDLASELDISGASLARSVDRLVAAGLVERHADPEDGRVNRIRLTEKGATRLETIEAALAEVRRGLLAGLSDSDLARAMQVSRYVASAFDRSDNGR
jgi:MarR family transcriptional regulator for hemolysin